MDPKLKTWIADTYQEIGMKSMRPTRDRLLVRTFARPTHSEGGIIYLKPGFYEGKANETVLKGIVIAAGKNCLAEPGDFVLMQRLHFGSVWKLDRPNKGSHVGWIYEVYLVGYLADTTHPITGEAIGSDPRRMIVGDNKGQYTPARVVPTAAYGDDSIGRESFVENARYK